MGRPTVKSDWKDGFLFVGNELVLDFVNTRPVQNGKAQELLPDFDAVLRWFRAAGLLRGPEFAQLKRAWSDTREAQRTTEALQRLREKLRKEILSWEKGEAVHRETADELNELMIRHPMRTRLIADGRAYSTELWFEVKAPEDLFASLAHSAAKLLTETDRKRVRKCDQCVLHFHDTSKKGTRRWCSMQLCGNRLKVAAYAARRSRKGHISASH